MAYSRWLNSDWYIFWCIPRSTKIEDQLLAIWHKNSKELQTYNYKQVKDMYEKQNLSVIPGYKEKDKEFLLSVIKKWIEDVENKYN